MFSVPKWFYLDIRAESAVYENRVRKELIQGVGGRGGLAINLQGASLDRKEIHILFVHVLFSYARLQGIMHNIQGQFALEVKLLTCESSLLIKLQICRHLKAVIMQLVPYSLSLLKPFSPRKQDDELLKTQQTHLSIPWGASTANNIKETVLIARNA
ncbi:hypothetical protein NC652_036664 [Populus alba x Populus x berolinensis]|nr:hypothetical protein NC652_036664 [Populus alba x Populus x berolinensis]